MAVNPKYYALETERLKCRKICMDDAEVWQELFTPDFNRNFVGLQDREGSNLELAKYWLSFQTKREESGEYGQLAILEKETNKFVGVAGIIERNMDELDLFEVTYSLLPNYRGMGYASEITRAFLSFANQEFVGKNIGSIIHLGNDPSIAVAEKLGFAYSRTVRMFDKDFLLYLK